MECCKEFLRRIARYLIELGCVSSLSRELRSNEYAEYCKEFVWRIARYLIEQSAVRSLLGELQGI